MIDTTLHPPPANRNEPVDKGDAAVLHAELKTLFADLKAAILWALAYQTFAVVATMVLLYKLC